MKNSETGIFDHLTLLKYFNRGNRVKYVFFWGHQARKDGGIGKHCFSQWFTSPFMVEDIFYPTAEHYMMAQKARLFNDRETLARILAAKNPGEAKHLGRTVKGFSEQTWNENRFD